MGRRKKRAAILVGEEPPRPGREEGRRQRRQAGARSAGAAHALMDLPDAAFARLELEPELRAEVERARTIPSHGARRREERRLAGVLRDYELEEVEDELSKVGGQAHADALQFQRAEIWRAKLLDEERGTTATAVATLLADVGGSDSAMLTQLVDEARRQATSGRKRGAAKELFRQIIAALRAKERAAR